MLNENYRTIDRPMAEESFYTDEYGTFISAYAPFYTSDGKPAGIIGADITATKVLERERQALQFYILISLLAIPLVALSGWYLGNRLAIPIATLTQAAVRISKGELDFRPDIKANSSEIALLKSAFYSTADQLQSLIGDLERRVAERTKALDRRAIQLQAAADVGAAAVRLLDLDELLKQVTYLISERFGFYHVGIFLLDERGENAILRAANSEGGQRMLERGHKLKVGHVGIVGYVTALAEPRIALDVGKDAVFFDNPDLPQTRSEMALPLLIGDRILGALDVQSTQEAAFSEEDISTLRVLANQISIAIDNARLFAERQSALDTTRRAFGEISRIGWQRVLSGESSSIGYICTADSLSPISSQASPEYTEAFHSGKAVLANGDTTLHLPIKVRDEIIGAIRLDKAANQGQWTKDDISMANALSEQLGTALESARLFQETSRRATRERAVSEITTHFRRTTDPQDMIRTALEELRRVLGAGEIQIHPYYPGQEDKNEENKLGRDDLPTTSRF
jgi:GAF domain-containing protein/HAMP domain-containing protein